jgi:hypothetical protein
MAEFLLNHSVHINLEDSDKRTALRYAEQNKHVDVMTFLKAKGAKGISPTPSVKPPALPAGDFWPALAEHQRMPKSATYKARTKLLTPNAAK